MRLQCMLTIAAATGLLVLGQAGCRSKEKPGISSALKPDPGRSTAQTKQPGMPGAAPVTHRLAPVPMRPVVSADAGAAVVSADAGAAVVSADAGATVIPPNAGAAELYAMARQAWLGGECAKAIDLARAANRKKFSKRHVSIIGACACSLRRTATAKWAYKILHGGQRNMLFQICRSKGIELP